MKIAVIDFETTGLLDATSTDWIKQPGIVQIGVCILVERAPEAGGGMMVGEPPQTFEMKVNPEMPIPDVVSRIHGIRDEDVKDAPTCFSALPALASFILGCQYWGGYNTKFDRDVLWYQLMRYGLEKNFPWPIAELDAMRLVSQKLGNVAGKSHDRWKLSAAYERLFGVQLVGAHDALNDVNSTAKIIAELWRP